MSETTKAIAKAVEATADAVKPLTTVTGRILENLMEEPTKELGGLLADRLRARRVENLRGLAARTTAKLGDRELLDAPIPLGFLGPAIEGAKDVDEPDLQELWAELIANGAADDENQQPRHIQTLAGVSAGDAKVFDEYVRADNAALFVRRGRVGGSWWEQNPTGERLRSLGLLEPAEDRPEPHVPRAAERKALSLGHHDYPLRISNYGRQFARAVGIVPNLNTDSSK